MNPFRARVREPQLAVRRSTRLETPVVLEQPLGTGLGAVCWQMVYFKGRAKQ